MEEMTLISFTFVKFIFVEIWVYVRMPLRLDRVDVAILKALMKDGRRSYRQLAKETGVSAPTVESRVRRMLSTGFIKRIAPIFEPEKVSGGITALVSFKVDTSRVEEIASRLAELEEVRSIFTTTGEGNLLVRVVLDDARALQEFLTSKTQEFKGLQVASSQIVTRTMKDEQGVVVKPNIGIPLTCDYCKGEVKGEPFKLRVGEGERYFCCETCLSSYKEKYGARIRALNKMV